MLNDFIRYLWGKFGEETLSNIPHASALMESLHDTAIQKHPQIPKIAGEKVSGTINIEDFKILYPLIRLYRPKIIFEIGTWIGTSSMLMAEAMKKNEEIDEIHIYTCDKNRYFSLDESYRDFITPINEYSDVALESIPSDLSFDLIFTDGELTYPTIKRLIPRLKDTTIIVTHDYTRPAEKGVRNFIRMQLFTSGYFVPLVPSIQKSIRTVNSSVGILLPPHIAKQSGIRTKPRMIRLLFTLIHLFLVNLYLFIRRVVRVVISIHKKYL